MGRDVQRVNRAWVGQEIGEVGQRLPPVGVCRPFPDHHHVLDARRVAEIGLDVTEERVLHDHHPRLGRVEDV